MQFNWRGGIKGVRVIAQLTPLRLYTYIDQYPFFYKKNIG